MTPSQALYQTAGQRDGEQAWFSYPKAIDSAFVTSTTHATIDTVDDALANLARCARLRQAVLERAFAGRLVAGEDSIDEAAAAPTSVDCRAPSSARKTRRRASSRRPAR